MAAIHSDALVFFGATGDLAYKKIFPALQAMVKRGHLDVPVIGVAKAGWNLDQFKARAQGQRGEAWRPRSRGVRQAGELAALRRWRLQRPGDVSSAAQAAWRRRATRRIIWPSRPLLFGTVVEQLVKSGCTQGARVIVEKPFGHDLASAQEPQSHPAQPFAENGDLPHRPLSGQAAGEQHAVLPLCQLLSGAVLEPQLTSRACRSPWRRTSASRAAARFTTRPAPSATSCRTTCSRSWQSGHGAAGPHGQRIHSR